MSELDEYKDKNFSFNGVDIADLGLEYTPDLNNTYVYSQGAFDVSEESFAAHDGGYFYGTTVKPKDFTLRCIFQSTHLNSGQMTRIAHVFKRGTTGRLIFHNRPWCWYVATVVKDPQIQPTNYLNGVITFTLRAYYPFARTYQTYIYDDDPNEEDIINNSAMLKGAEWDTAKDFGPMTEQTTICIFNPGTETAAMSIGISGSVGAGVTIYNKLTQQTCELVAYNSQDSLILDSLSGKVLKTDGSTTSYGYLYHDNGFIDLASNYPIMRDVALHIEHGQNRFETTDDDVYFTDDLIGKQVSFYLSDNSGFLGEGVVGDMILNNSTTADPFYLAKIVGVAEDGKSFDTDTPVDLDGDSSGDVTEASMDITASIVQFNELVITPKDSMNLTKFAVSYLPTFS